VYERVYLTAPVPALDVVALPEQGRTARFAGIVGPAEVQTAITATNLVVGQPVLFTVQLDQLAFARHLAALPAAAFDGLRPEFQLTTEPIRETATDRARSFTYILRPLRAGISRVPAVVIQTFDPEAGGYQTLRTAALPITVAPGVGETLVTGGPRRDAKPLGPLTGIRHNRIHERTTMTILELLAFLGRYWWVFVPVPPVLWLALRPLARHWDRCRRDPVYARAATARRRFRRTAGRDEETAWRNYLADRLALCAPALTADTVAAALRDRQVDAALIAEVRRQFEEQDATEYGQRPAAARRSARALVRQLQRATVPVLVLCLSALPVIAASPDAMFARAVELRETKPDEAQPLFVEAALAFESAGEFLNAGNSWFFAGETGRALANYRAAERRAPFDRQLQESLRFIRANRVDALAPPAAADNRLAVLWHRFGNWSPVFRVGLLVLVYLSGWAVVLVALLSGWRIRRAVWVTGLVVALVPAVSLLQTSCRPAAGVVLEDSVARLGPGYAYDPAFERPLHQATEFAWLETRPGWVRARLPDKSEGWLRESACRRVR
jgi:hypothetical protein